MAEIPDNIKHVLSEYVQKLSQDINVRSAILFGSYATGKWDHESDIDIAIFSDDFSSMDRVEAITFLLNKALPYDPDIQPLAYDENDLKNSSENPFIQEILITGIKII
jgi:predicted nucleotidyltransferase